MSIVEKKSDETLGVTVSLYIVISELKGGLAAWLIERSQMDPSSNWIIGRHETFGASMLWITEQTASCKSSTRHESRLVIASWRGGLVTISSRTDSVR